MIIVHTCTLKKSWYWSVANISLFMWVYLVIIVGTMYLVCAEIYLVLVG